MLLQLLGLTSERNLAFVQRLGLYDSVVTYSSATSVLDASKAVILVDMAGNAATIAALHNHYGSNMKHSCRVGATHRESATAALPSELPGAKPQFFFAPSRISKRSKQWGADGLQQRMCEAWKDFVERVSIELLWGARVCTVGALVHRIVVGCSSVCIGVDSSVAAGA